MGSRALARPDTPKHSTSIVAAASLSPDPDHSVPGQNQVNVSTATSSNGTPSCPGATLPLHLTGARLARSPPAGPTPLALPQVHPQPRSPSHKAPLHEREHSPVPPGETPVTPRARTRGGLGPARRQPPPQARPASLHRPLESGREPRQQPPPSGAPTLVLSVPHPHGTHGRRKHARRCRGLRNQATTVPRHLCGHRCHPVPTLRVSSRSYYLPVAPAWSSAQPALRQGRPGPPRTHSGTKSGCPCLQQTLSDVGERGGPRSPGGHTGETPATRRGSTCPSQPHPTLHAQRRAVRAPRPPRAHARPTLGPPDRAAPAARHGGATARSRAPGLHPGHVWTACGGWGGAASGLGGPPAAPRTGPLPSHARAAPAEPFPMTSET